MKFNIKAKNKELTIKENLINYINSHKKTATIDTSAIEANLVLSADSGYAEQSFAIEELSKQGKLTKEQVVEQLKEWNKDRLNLTFEDDKVYINWGYFFNLKESDLLTTLRTLTYQEPTVSEIINKLEDDFTNFIVMAISLLDEYGVELDLPKDFQSKTTDRHANLINKIKKEGFEVEYSESLDKIFILLNLK